MTRIKHPFYTEELMKLLDTIIDESVRKGVPLSHDVLEVIQKLYEHRPMPLLMCRQSGIGYHHMLNRYPTTVNPLKPVKPIPAIPDRKIRTIRRFALHVIRRYRCRNLYKALNRLADILSAAAWPERVAPYIAYQLPLPPEHQTRIMLSMIATAKKYMQTGIRLLAYVAKHYIDQHIKDTEQAIKAKQVLKQITGLGDTIYSIKFPGIKPILITHPQQYVEVMKDTW
ncbi:MAG: hypothetical protein GXO43_05950 [Crenarchaeota archaeon]|nr:hypothetical protein [Thermoproteota archaeon]